MPKTVKAFVWLGALYILYGAALLAWSIHGLSQATAALHLPPHTRESLENQMLGHVLRPFAIHTVIFAVLAGFAAFGRRNWARWALALYFVLGMIEPLVRDGVLYLSSPKLFHYTYGDAAAWWRNYLQMRWLSPPWPQWASLAFWIVLLVLIFSPGSRLWFRRPVS